MLHTLCTGAVCVSWIRTQLFDLVPSVLAYADEGYEERRAFSVEYHHGVIKTFRERKKCCVQQLTRTFIGST